MGGSTILGRAFLTVMCLTVGAAVVEAGEVMPPFPAGPIEARGIAVPPISAASSTPAERMVAARTAALVIAVGNIVPLLEGVRIITTGEEKPTDGGAGALAEEEMGFRFEGELGGVLRVRGESALKDMQLLRSTVELAWPARAGLPEGRIRVENAMLASPAVRDLDVYAFLAALDEAGISLVKWEAHPDGTVEARVRFHQRGGTSSLVGPKVRVAASCADVHTGVIVDARGPALAPRILSAGGLEVYGRHMVAGGAVVAGGVVEYAQGLEGAKANPRAGDRPLVVEAVRSAGERQASAVVSDEDAVKMLVADHCGRVLERAKVVIVPE